MTYKYFVLLHDVQEGEISKAHQIYENLKSTFGSSNCHLLQINSKTNQPPDQLKSLNTSTNTAPIEFDPWLKYCKYNDLFNNTATSNGTTQYPRLNSMSKSQNSDQETPIVEMDTEQSNDYTINNPLNQTSDFMSLPVETPVVKRHGMCLALSDHDRIKTLISEFLQRGLVPYVERTIKILNEQIQSKKSILKSFGIPRRIFGGGSSSNSSSIASANSKSSPIVSMSGLATSGGSAASSSNPQLLTITNSFATNDELQLRRLADLAFMFRLYDLAYNSYHTCKKEFTSNLNNTSQSSTEQILNKTFYLAGALEMASLANFMQNFNGTDMPSLPNSSSQQNMSNISSFKSYNLQYIDEAIQLYFNTCKNSYFATRCALLSTEALKANNFFVKAAYQFISLSSDESDMRSALFLEQAAQCYLAMSMLRKYAFFMSVAGYRFNKAGQKKTLAKSLQTCIGHL